MKVLCIVQARMGSERLPGKVLKKINGNPMIFYTLKRLKESRYIDEIVLATSTKDIDTPLANYVSSLGVDVFRGSEGNVLERYKLASDKYGCDVIVRVTGDCPLIDSIIVDNAITKYLMYDYDYLRLDVPETFLRGFDVEVFSHDVLDRVYSIVCSEEGLKNCDYEPYREHVTYYIYKHPKDFKIGYLKGENKIFQNINLSVDREEDFLIVKEIIESFEENLNYKNIYNYLKNRYSIDKL